ncbi:MAG: peptidoglycan DD-metalloendopeptidase family protein [Parvularculaceae bacterium]
MAKPMIEAGNRRSATLKLAAVMLATGAMTACASGNRAPVVYGTQPVAQPTARIYTSPQQIAAEQRAAQRSAYAPRGYSGQAYGASTYRPALDDIVLEPAVATAGLAPLTPISETYREGRASYNVNPSYDAAYDIRPTYIAEAQIDPYQPAAELPGQVTVLPGDTVYAISRRTGASPQAIISLNRLDAPYRLEVGETIRVPSSAVPPKRDVAAAPSASRDGAHIVRAGETLYSIARATGVPVDAIARANSFGSGSTLRVGQTLRIPAASGQIAEAARAPEADVGDLARNVSYGAAPAKSGSLFDWPVQGRMIGSFGLSEAGRRNDGVNIAAPVGTPVRAAADGEVVYRGSELSGYGNLLLIKHDDGFVTAYAHNDAMLVKKGDRVRKGQVIAKVGQTGSAGEPQLHFEIRQNLKAIDPVALLGSL